MAAAAAGGCAAPQSQLTVAAWIAPGDEGLLRNGGRVFYMVSLRVATPDTDTTRQLPRRYNEFVKLVAACKDAVGVAPQSPLPRKTMGTATAAQVETRRRAFDVLLGEITKDGSRFHPLKCEPTRQFLRISLPSLAIRADDAAGSPREETPHAEGRGARAHTSAPESPAAVGTGDSTGSSPSPPQGAVDASPSIGPSARARKREIATAAVAAAGAAAFAGAAEALDLLQPLLEHAPVIGKVFKAAYTVRSLYKRAPLNDAVLVALGNRVASLEGLVCHISERVAQSLATPARVASTRGAADGAAAAAAMRALAHLHGHGRDGASSYSSNVLILQRFEAVLSKVRDGIEQHVERGKVERVLKARSIHARCQELDAAITGVVGDYSLAVGLSTADSDDATATELKEIRRLLETASASVSSPIATAPFPSWLRRNHSFVGRDDELDDLHRRLFSTAAAGAPSAGAAAGAGSGGHVAETPAGAFGWAGGSGRRCVVTALGGMGKSELVASFALASLNGGAGHTEAVVSGTGAANPRTSAMTTTPRLYPAGVFWVHAERLSSDMRAAGKTMVGVSDDTMASGSDTDVRQAVHQWLMAHSGWLLVIDNVDDARHLAVGDADVGRDSWLPGDGAPGHVVMTSRLAPTHLCRSADMGGLGIARRECLQLRPLSVDAAVALLSALRQDSGLGGGEVADGPGSSARSAGGAAVLSPAELEAARKLAGPSHLDGLPLALAHAASFVRERPGGFTFAEYLALFQDGAAAGSVAEALAPLPGPAPPHPPSLSAATSSSTWLAQSTASVSSASSSLTTRGIESGFDDTGDVDAWVRDNHLPSSLVAALRSTGVEFTDDLAFVAGADLETAGVPAVARRKFLKAREAWLSAEQKRRDAAAAAQKRCVALTWELNFAQVRAANPRSAELLELLSLLGPDRVPWMVFRLWLGLAPLPDVGDEDGESPGGGDDGDDGEGGEGGEDGGAGASGAEAAATVSSERELVQWQAAVKSLERYNLVTVVPARRAHPDGDAETADGDAPDTVAALCPSLAPSVSVHRLVQLVVRDTVMARTPLAEALAPGLLPVLEGFVDTLKAVAAAHDSAHARRAAADGDAMMPHVESLFTLPLLCKAGSSGGEEPQAAAALQRASAGLWTRAADHMLRVFQFVRGEKLARCAVVMRETQLRHTPAAVEARAGAGDAEPTAGSSGEPGERSPAAELATALHYWAHALVAQRNFESAKVAYKRSRELRQRELGDHLHTVKSLSSLANLYYDTHKHVKSEHMFRQALAVRRRLGVEGRVDTAKVLNGLGNALTEQRRYDEAEAAYRDALKMRRSALSADHPFTSASLNNLARLLSRVGKHEEAERLYREALAMKEKLLADHPSTATALNNLALELAERGKHAEAAELLQRARDICLSSLGDHTDTADTLHNLGRTFVRLRRLDDAETALRQAADMRMRRLGDDVQTTASLRCLADLLRDRGRTAEAEEVAKQRADMLARLAWERDDDDGPMTGHSSSSSDASGDDHGRVDTYVEAAPSRPTPANDRDGVDDVQKLRDQLRRMQAEMTRHQEETAREEVEARRRAVLARVDTHVCGAGAGPPVDPRLARLEGTPSRATPAKGKDFDHLAREFGDLGRVFQDTSDAADASQLKLLAELHQRRLQNLAMGMARLDCTVMPSLLVLRRQLEVARINHVRTVMSSLHVLLSQVARNTDVRAFDHDALLARVDRLAVAVLNAMVVELRRGRLVLPQIAHVADRDAELRARLVRHSSELRGVDATAPASRTHDREGALSHRTPATGGDVEDEAEHQLREVQARLTHLREDVKRARVDRLYEAVRFGERRDRAESGEPPEGTAAARREADDARAQLLASPCPTGRVPDVDLT